MNKKINEFLTFDSKELLISIAIVLVVLGFIFYPKLVEKTNKNLVQTTALPVPTVVSDGSAAKDNYKNSYEKRSSEDTYNNYNNKVEAVLKPFNFNPNTLSEEGLLKLGLKPKTVKTILNYRNKGGKFYKPEDIRKIWGLQTKEADALIPFIELNENDFNYKKNSVFSAPSKKTNSLPQIICINTATAYDFKSLPALGNVAFKIVNFRDKLGGFIDVNQVKETSGLPDSVYQLIQPYLSIKNTTVTKLNINTATEYELSKHPYISRDIAKAIVIYRNQNGNYQNIEGIKKIVFIKSDVFEKIKPYLSN